MRKVKAEDVIGRGGGGGGGRRRRVGGMNLLGERIRQLREERGLKQVELAARIGYTNGWLSSVERGEYLCGIQFIRDVERGLGLGDEEGSSGELIELGRRLEIWGAGNGRQGDVGDWGMTVSEAGEWLGIGRSRIYKMVREGDIPFVQVDRFKRIRISALEDYCRDWGVESEGIREWLKERRQGTKLGDSSVVIEEQVVVPRSTHTESVQTR